MVNLDQAITIANLLRQSGLNVQIAGGVCRDEVFGAKASDIDLFISEHEFDRDKLLNVRRAFGLRFSRLFGGFSEGENPYNGRVDEQFVDVFESGKVDLIVRKEYHSPEELVSHFDMNVNQYYYCFQDECIKHLDGDEAPHLTGEVKIYRESTKSGRQEAILSKLMLNV